MPRLSGSSSLRALPVYNRIYCVNAKDLVERNCRIAAPAAAIIAAAVKVALSDSGDTRPQDFLDAAHSVLYHKTTITQSPCPSKFVQRVTHTRILHGHVALSKRSVLSNLATLA